MFNVRIKRFYDSEQIQVFSKAVHSKGEIIRKPFDTETGEILVRKRLKNSVVPGEWMETPFTDYEDGIDYFYNMDETIEEQIRHEDSIKLSCCRSISAIYDIARSNYWEWFFTFTFNPDKVNRYNYDECTSKFSIWLKNMRKVCPDMVYLVVPEQHKDGAFHFHGLFSYVDSLDFQFSGVKDNKGNWVYNIGNYRWGFTTATKIKDFRRASSYLCKYITKELCVATFGKKRYWNSRNVCRPEVVEFMVEEKVLNRLKMACDGTEQYVKQVRTQYTDVIYIDKPIYTTNTESFSKASASDN